MEKLMKCESEVVEKLKPFFFENQEHPTVTPCLRCSNATQQKTIAPVRIHYNITFCPHWMWHDMALSYYTHGVILKCSLLCLCK